MALEHMTAQGARVAVLEAEVSKLERLLESARTSEGVWRKRLEAAADALSDVAPGEMGRLDILSRIAFLRAERDEAQEGLKTSRVDAIRAARSKVAHGIAEALEAYLKNPRPPNHYIGSAVRGALNALSDMERAGG